MHKLLKAKQDLIDIQKKRIEHLCTRGHSNNLTSLMNKSISNIQYQQQNYEDTNPNLVIKQMNKLSNMNTDDVKLNNVILSTASKINDKIVSQVAASPSSSSSSMSRPWRNCISIDLHALYSKEQFETLIYNDCICVPKKDFKFIKTN